MTIKETYGTGKFGLSFELFPPKTAAGEKNLFRHVERLMTHQPDYITCTYGAGGSTQDKTLAIVARVRQECNVPVATHLTCVGRTVHQLRQYLAAAQAKGVQNVVALRGDPPQGETEFQTVEGGLSYGNELVALIHAEFPDFGIAVGGYPETHQEAHSPEVDLENLKLKVDAGADVVITQLFYDNDDFFRFRERCDAVGIDVPIVPGLLPVTNFAQIQRISSLCGAKLPERFIAELAAAGDDSDAQFQAGVDFAANQAQSLVDEGIPGLHFYVLNRSEATDRVLSNITLPQ